MLTILALLHIQVVSGVEGGDASKLQKAINILQTVPAFSGILLVILRHWYNWKLSKKRLAQAEMEDYLYALSSRPSSSSSINGSDNTEKSENGHLRMPLLARGSSSSVSGQDFWHTTQRPANTRKNSDTCGASHIMRCTDGAPHIQIVPHFSKMLGSHFRFATQLCPRNDWPGWLFCVDHDACRLHCAPVCMSRYGGMSHKAMTMETSTIQPPCLSSV